MVSINHKRIQKMDYKVSVEQLASDENFCLITMVIHLLVNRELKELTEQAKVGGIDQVTADDVAGYVNDTCEDEGWPVFANDVTNVIKQDYGKEIATINDIIRKQAT